MDNRKLDLNGLLALDFLFRENLVSRAVCMLGVSQPTRKAVPARLGTDQAGQ